MAEETKRVQETQTYLEETTPHLEAVSKALDLVEKDATDDAKKALKESVTAYKTVREGIGKKLTEVQAQAKAAKEVFDKSMEEFKKKDAVVPKDSLVSLERVQALKKYAVENGLSEEQFNGMVKYDHDLLSGMQAHNQGVVKETLAKYEAELSKNPKFSGANKTVADQKIDALLKVKGKPELIELMKTVPQANHPLFREFLLDIANGMEPGTLILGETQTDSGAPEYAKEFSKTAADAKAAGVKPR